MSRLTIDPKSRIISSSTSSPTPPPSKRKPSLEDGTKSTANARRTPARKSSLGKSARVKEEKTTTEIKYFSFEEDASAQKYMPHFGKLDPKLGLEDPVKYHHSIKQDPSGTLTTWEYDLPSELWTKHHDKSKVQEVTPLKIRWGSENGYVLVTEIGKALYAKHAIIQRAKEIEAMKKGMADLGKSEIAAPDISTSESKLPPLKISDFVKGYDEHTVRVRGGQINVQGSWLPYDMAREVCLRKCYVIREYLVPIFGPGFAASCIPDGPEQEPGKRRPGRRRKSPPVVVERSSEELLDDDCDQPIDTEEPPTKRIRRFEPPSYRYKSPASATDIDLNTFTPPSKPRGFSEAEVISAAHCLMSLKYCSSDGYFGSPAITPGGPNYQDHQYKGHNNNALVQESASSPIQKSRLPSIRNLVQSVPAHQRYNQYPTPSPHESPLELSMNWPNQTPSPARQSLMSPPNSIHNSFSGKSGDRRFSNNTDECHTPTQEFADPLFYTPDSESRHCDSNDE